MNLPRISIIVPIYNIQEYLPQCLESILSQTFSDWECILVDDGSKDKSGLICDIYAERDSRFVVIHKKNEGVSCARNTGLDIAKGEWILFVDSDDYLQNDYIEGFIICAEHKTDFIFSGHKKFRNGCVIDEVRFQPGLYEGERKSEIVQILLRVGTPWAKAYKREIINREQIRFDKNLTLSEDRLFMYTYLQFVESVYISDKTGYYYRITPTSISFTRRRACEYIYRLDALGEQSALLIARWKIPLRILYPFVDIHMQMERDIVKRLGLSFLLENSKIANKKDFFKITQYPLLDRMYMYYQMGFYNYLLYYNKWRFLKLFENKQNKVHE